MGVIVNLTQQPPWPVASTILRSLRNVFDSALLLTPALLLARFLLIDHSLGFRNFRSWTSLSLYSAERAAPF
ncbi:hypothetical protein PsYK624_155250 [Phanerochaete sordida]|uniref:Uncharacterized protein n=1 Tax=Phanerochaete sordida TaxID=48140 RepID=A0A9P3GPD7_9APHY|nr:hypothetical protein PsYK624_155250 [Phanerochaete sordida]